MTFEGTSGVYALYNDLKAPIVSYKYILIFKALFKPEDEEPYAPHNPRGFVGKLGQPGIRNGILSGECATREYLASLLDPYNFHGVPRTFFVKIDHPFFQKQEPNLKKMGSLQCFVNHHDVVANYGTKCFSL